MKFCNKCKTNKPPTEFGKNRAKKDGLQALCSECNKASNKKWYIKNKVRKIRKNKANADALKKWFHDLKHGLRCIYCRESDPRCLDFHHRNPADKEVGISEAVHVLGWSKKRILEELKKCDVLCANCHRKETFRL